MHLPPPASGLKSLAPPPVRITLALSAAKPTLALSAAKPTLALPAAKPAHAGGNAPSEESHHCRGYPPLSKTSLLDICHRQRDFPLRDVKALAPLHSRNLRNRRSPHYTISPRPLTCDAQALSAARPMRPGEIPVFKIQHRYGNPTLSEASPLSQTHTIDGSICHCQETFAIVRDTRHHKGISIVRDIPYRQRHFLLMETSSIANNIFHCQQHFRSPKTFSITRDISFCRRHFDGHIYNCQTFSIDKDILHCPLTFPPLATFSIVSNILHRHGHISPPSATFLQ